MTVTAKKTEFICMGCWGTFSPQPNTEGDVTCPHCGARQDVQHEPIELDPEEFVDLGPEFAGSAAAAAAADAATDADAPGPAAARDDDDDFDAVIEIDLDEIDSNDAFLESGVPLTEPLPEPEERMAYEALVDEGPAADEPQERLAAQSHFYLRTEHSHVYVFLSPEALILWARRLRQSQKALHVSLDGVDWQPFLPFLTRLAATGQISAEVQRAIGAIDVPDEAVSDADLARSLADEKNAFEGSAPESEPDAAQATTGKGRGGKSAEAAPPPAETGPARGVGDFTFKVDERLEKIGVRYAAMLGIGVVLGAGIVTVLSLLGVLPPRPF